MDVVETEFLLPQPKRIEHRPGHCGLAVDTVLLCDVEDGRIARAFHRLAGELNERLPGSGARSGKPFDVAVVRGCVEVRVDVDPARVPYREGYRLEIRPDAIEVLGGAAAGCFYGLQTLSQLVRLRGGELPCAVIDDHPDLPVRGVLHDITRGKSPTLATLKRLVDRLASWKANQLHLYIEHAFVFSFDPDICDADHGLTPDDARELDTYATERFITLVPALATFGHMGRVLSMPQYRHLAEVPCATSWEDTDWPGRARGLTLDPTRAESHELLRRMWSDVLDAFSSPTVNICGDEPWDLGKGERTGALAPAQLADTYVEHLKRTQQICASRGRRCQMWSDVIRRHPDQLSRLPRDIAVLHWGYDDKSDYDGTRAFVERGFETMVCPGTSGWKRIMNGIEIAERNISSFAGAAKAHGAAGLLNTDWGDHGHFNALACSWHGFAVGAASAWSTNHPVGAESGAHGATFDERFAWQLFGSESLNQAQGRMFGRLLREAAQIGDRHETWRLMWLPREMVAGESGLPSPTELERCVTASQRLSALLKQTDFSTAATDNARADLMELGTAADFQALFAQKLMILASEGRGIGPCADEWADKLRAALATYESTWLRHNKPSGLSDISRALRRTAVDMREYAFAR